MRLFLRKLRSGLGRVVCVASAFPEPVGVRGGRQPFHGAGGRGNAWFLWICLSFILTFTLTFRLPGDMGRVRARSMLLLRLSGLSALRLARAYSSSRERKLLCGRDSPFSDSMRSYSRRYFMELRSAILGRSKSSSLAMACRALGDCFMEL